MKKTIAIFLSAVLLFFGAGSRMDASKQRKAALLDVRNFGAAGNGIANDTKAIQRALDSCRVLGGGVVVFPAGTYRTGALKLYSNTTLRLEDHSIIAGTPDYAEYPVGTVRWEGKWIQGHTALICASDANNIAIVGRGKIAGNHALGGRPTKDNPLRHPALIEMTNCKNIQLENFSSDYCRMWSIHLTYCENIAAKHLSIHSTGGNGDGIDLDSDRHVIIDGCDFVTGDDCIALKSGRGMEGYKLARPTEDVTITNCTFADSLFACIGIGSETSGGIRKAVIKNCRFTYAKTYAIYIKSRPGRGAFIEDITADHLQVSGMKGGFLRMNLLSSGLQDQEPVPGLDGIPTIKKFRFSHVRVHDVPVLVDGVNIHPDKPLEGLMLHDITGTCRKGISLAHIKNADLRHIHVAGCGGPLLGIYNVTGTGLKGAVSIDAPKLPDPIPVNK